jgi:4-alpha-glucanotransferase
LPNSTQGNWSWRFNRDALTEDHSGRLREMTATYGRIQASQG